MIKLILSIHFFIMASFCIAQTDLKEINKINSPQVALAPLKFLASDELMGRGTTRPEINIAARYISEEFKSMGIREVPGTNDYFQTFSIKLFTPSKTGALTVNNTTYNMGQDIIQMSGTDISLNAPIVYAGFGLKEDLDKTDVKGKIILTKWGANDSSSPQEGFVLLETKQKLAQERGVAALIEPAPSAIPWEAAQQYFMREHVQMEGTDNFSTFLINDKNSSLFTLPQNQSATISVTGNQVRSISVKNVMGRVEGTDAKLKDQFIVLSAHYDHLGVAQQPKMEEGKVDSIYNGARDNAIGTTAVIDAARYFAQHPPKRSILFIAFTAEEMGLIGSKYFAEHPALPLKQLVYDFNIDNASYNDTTIVTFVGLGRTSADADIKRACDAYGLSILPDPTPGKELFYGSDNLPLAEKGIPAPTFSLGMRTFDSTIFNRYHQLSDEVGNFNLNYAVKFIDAFILAAKYIADNDQQPTWTKGDKYEAAWKQLYH
jgi:hypothetical protein